MTSFQSISKQIAEDEDPLHWSPWGKAFQILIPLTKTLVLKFPLVGKPARLAFELGAVLVECPVNVLVSVPDGFKTIIIHLDIVGAETSQSGFTNRGCKSCPRIFFALSRDIHWQTQILIFLKNMKLDRISRFTSLEYFCILFGTKNLTRWMPNQTPNIKKANFWCSC